MNVVTFCGDKALHDPATRNFYWQLVFQTGLFSMESRILL